jgi:hypothetical protein
MNRPQATRCWALLLALVCANWACCGCASRPNLFGLFSSKPAEPATTTAAAPAATATPPVAATTPPPSTAQADAPKSQELQQIMAELKTMSALTPEAQAQLLADLEQTDPALWPQMLQVFRASLAYRQRVNPLPGSEGAASDKHSPTNKPPVVSSGDAAGAIAVAKADPAPPQSAGNPPVSKSPAATNAAAIPPVTVSAAPSAASNAPSGPAVLPTADVQAATPIPSQAAGGAASNAPSAASSGIRQVSLDAPVASAPAAEENWNRTLAASIASLEKETSQPPRTSAEISRHAYLRMLYLAAGRRDDAMRPIPGLSAAEQDFWVQEFYGLSTYLDAQQTPDVGRRAADAVTHLTKASTRLSETGSLVVHNLAFCTEVSSYGVYTPFERHEFKAGQQVLLYVEVDNFQSEESAKGYHTSLRSSYHIVDSQGRHVADRDLSATEETCQNRRRDYFIRYFLYIPERIYEGKYTLQLTIEDTLSRKIGQSSIEFTVSESSGNGTSAKEGSTSENSGKSNFGKAAAFPLK